MTNKYSLSKSFQAVRLKGVCFCFNSLMGKYAIIDNDTYQLFMLLQKKQYTKRQLEAIVEQANLEERLKEYVDCRLVIKNGKDEQKEISKQKKEWENKLKKKNQISFIGFTVTDKCNFKCTYCIKRKCDSLAEKNKESVLQWQVAKKALDQFFKIVSSEKKPITVGFIGGEPLLNFEVIRKIVEYTQEKLGLRKKVNFAITTNGTLITKEIAKFLARYKFDVGVSLDGLRKANNKVRIYKDDRGTFDDILSGIKILKKYYSAKNKIVISTTLSTGNFNIIDTSFLDFIKALGVNKLSFEPDLIALASNDYRKVVNKLFKFYEYGRSIGVAVFGYWSRPFTKLLENKLSPIASCAPLRGEAIAINADGTIQPCGYIDETIFPLNELNKINTIPRYRKFLMGTWKGNLKRCKGCEIEGICLGGCYVTHVVPKRKIFEYRCFLYKQLTYLLIRHFLKENYEKIQDKFSES